jgi:hypothetical protein
VINLIRIISQIDISEDDLDIPKTAAANDSTISTVLSFAFAIGAGVAMIVIIIAGIQFILSQGDPGKSAKARNAIIYAAIGLALCGLAFGIVRFVLVRVS